MHQAESPNGKIVKTKKNVQISSNLNFQVCYHPHSPSQLQVLEDLPKLRQVVITLMEFPGSLLFPESPRIHLTVAATEMFLTRSVGLILSKQNSGGSP